MQAFLEKYTRLQVDHDVFGNRDIFQLILSYLDAADLSAGSHVNFYWSTVIHSNPYMEISILRYRLNMSKDTIQQLRNKEKAQSKPKPRSLVPLFDVNKHIQASISRLQNFKGKTSQAGRNNFVGSLCEFAKEQAYLIDNQSDLTRNNWIIYSNYLEKLKNGNAEESNNGKKLQLEFSPASISRAESTSIIDTKMTSRVDFTHKQITTEPIPPIDLSSDCGLDFRDVYNYVKDEPYFDFHIYTGFKFFDINKAVKKMRKTQSIRKETPLANSQRRKANSQLSQDFDLNYFPI